MQDEKQIISNIKLISFLIFICSMGILVCLGINKFFSTKSKEEIVEADENYSYGEIDESKTPISDNYPKSLDTKISNMIGTTPLNLIQSGEIVSNENFIIYLKYNKDINNYDTYLLNKEKNNEKVILNNMNCHFLHLYNNFLIGVYDKTYNGTLKTDCIFIYNIEKDILITYDKVLGDISNRFITSFSIDENKMYFTEYYTNSLFTISFDGKKVNKLTDIKKTTFTGYSKIFDIKNNIISFTDGTNIGYLDLINNTVKYEDLFFLNYDNKKINVVTDNDNSSFYLDDTLIYKGNNIITLNYDKNLYFSDNNRLFKYIKDKELELIFEAPFLIEQIYLDNDFIILTGNQNNIIFLKGDTYEIYSQFTN